MANVIIPSNPEARKEIEMALKEISNAKLRVESEQEYIKDTINDISEKHDLPKKLINKVAVAYHKQTAQDVLDDADDFETLYDTIFKASN